MGHDEIVELELRVADLLEKDELTLEETVELEAKQKTLNEAYDEWLPKIGVDLETLPDAVAKHRLDN